MHHYSVARIRHSEINTSVLCVQVKLAQSAHLRLKTLRHPNILKYIDGIEVGVVTNIRILGVAMSFLRLHSSQRPYMW